MYCSSCGTQNADTSKFCIKCGQALSGISAQAPAYASTQSPSLPESTKTTRDSAATAALYGGIAGLVGGAISVVGWLMPWSNAVIVSISGLQITLGALTGSFAGLGTLQYSNAGWILVCLGFFFAAVFGAIPILGILCVRTGLSVFEYRSSHSSRYPVQDKLDQLRSRSVKGMVIMAAIFLVPLVLSALVSVAVPGFFALGQLGNLLPNSGYGNGFFLSAGGFVLVYIGFRLAQSQMSPP